jgi:hypothetical protein
MSAWGRVNCAYFRIPASGAYQYYIDGLKVNGKRQRLFFKEEKSAKTKLKELAKKTRMEGEDALALSHDFRMLAAKCSERLKPFGKTTGGSIGSHGSFSSPCFGATGVRRITDSRGARDKGSVKSIARRKGRNSESNGQLIKTDRRHNATFDPLEKRWKAGQFRRLIADKAGRRLTTAESSAKISGAPWLGGFSH